MRSINWNKYSLMVGSLLFILMAASISWAAGRMVVRGQFSYIVFGALIFLSGIFTFFKPRLIVVIILVGSFFLEYWVRQGFLPSAAQWGVDGLILILFSRLLVERSHLTGLFWKSPAFLGMVVWFVFMVFSAVANSTSAIQLVLGMRAYIRFMILYFCVLEFHLDMQFFSNAVKLLGLLILLQIPLQFLQKTQYSNPDLIGGSILGTGVLSVVVTAGFAAFVSYALLKRNLRILFLGLFLLAGPALANARAFVFIIPLVIGYVLFRFSSHIKRIFWIVPIILSVMGVLLMNWTYLQGRSLYRGSSAIDVLTDSSAALEELWMDPVQGTQGASIGRLRGLQLSWERIQESPITFLFGLGPASAQGSRFTDLRSGKFEDLTLVGGKASQLATSLLEWGVLGTGVYLLMLLALWLQSEMHFRREKDPFWKSVAFGHAVLVLLVIGLSFYTNTWLATAPGVLTWFIAGVLRRRRATLAKAAVA